MDDIISQFRLSVTNSLGNFNAKYTLQNPVICIPFIEQYTDLTAGWSAQISVEVMNSLNRCDAAFNSWLTPSATATPTVTPTPSITPSLSPTNTPSVTPTNTQTVTQTQTNTPTTTTTNTPSATPTNTPTTTTTSTPTPSVTNTMTPSVTQTETPTNTPTITSTPTLTPTCGTYTVQYLRSQQQGNKDIRFTLFDNPDFTGNANAVCDYTITGTYNIDGGAINQPYTTIMANNDHNHTYDTGFNITGFTVSNVVPACPCVNVVFNQVTPTPSVTQTSTPTLTPTPSSGGQLWNTITTNWNDETGLWNTV
jgi:hypothetical protein